MLLSDVAFISDECMDALEVQKDRVYVAPALNILYSSWLVAQKAQCMTPHIFIFDHTDLTPDVFAVGFKKSAAEKYKRELDICIAALKEMRRRGIKILPGGDYG